MTVQTDSRAVGCEDAMVIDAEVCENQAVLCVRGEIVYGAVEALGAALDRLPATTDSIVLDMADVTFMDSVGLRFLQELDDFSCRHAIPVRVINWRGQPRRVLEFAQQDSTGATDRDEPVDEPATAFSAVALERAEAVDRLSEQVQQLQQALASHPVIDQARGILMAAEACTADQAWDILREASQHANVKLRQVAATVVSSIEGAAMDEPVRDALKSALARSRAARVREA